MKVGKTSSENFVAKLSAVKIFPLAISKPFMKMKGRSDALSVPNFSRRSNVQSNITNMYMRVSSHLNVIFVKSHL